MAPSSSTPKILLSHLLKPSQLQEGPFVEQLKEKLEEHFKTSVYPLNSGRSAIFIGLKALGIGQGDEVLIQAYTCNSVPNPVLWTGATPTYVDIEEETLNMDLEDLERKISQNSRAIIVQHTFGNPAKIKEILKIADKYKLKVIEDCAHSLGASVDGRKLGTYGDLAIISFGREKIISSLTGGALIVNNVELKEPVETQIKNLKPLRKSQILKELGNYFSWRLLFRRLHSKEIGYNFIRFLYQFDTINVVTSQKELSGLKPSWYPAQMANVFAHVALNELSKIDQYNQKREEIAQVYQTRLKNPSLKILPPHEGVYLRVVGRHERASKLLDEARKRKLSFGSWYNAVIYPESVHLARLGYHSGSCPVAERLAQQTINLPNYIGITDKEIEKSLEFVNNFH